MSPVNDVIGVIAGEGEDAKAVASGGGAGAKGAERCGAGCRPSREAPRRSRSGCRRSARPTQEPVGGGRRSRRASNGA